MTIDLHTLSGAYAIDALSSEEVEMFDLHLAECSACRDEVRELREAAATMGASEAVTPPSALKARILAAADHHPQVPPKVTSITSAPSRRWTSRIVGAAAAVILIVTAGYGVSQMERSGGSDSSTVATGSVSQVFAAQDAHTATVKTANGSLRVATSEETGRMAIATDSLKALTAKQVYQMWAVHNGRSTSVGVVDLKAGKVMPIPAAGTTVAITVEPAGGSKQPTRRPIVEMDPASV